MACKDKALLFTQTLVDKLKHENAVLKRLKFAAQSEAYTADQRSLLEETLDTDLAAVAREIEDAQPKKPDGEKRRPKRAPLPAHLPRHDVHHEPASTTCKCGCTIVRINERTASIDPGDGTKWRVGFGLLRHVLDI